MQFLGNAGRKAKGKVTINTKGKANADHSLPSPSLKFALAWTLVQRDCGEPTLNVRKENLKWQTQDNLEV